MEHLVQSQFEFVVFEVQLLFKFLFLKLEVIFESFKLGVTLL